jgi:modulator of FtsH protease HflK
MTDFGPNDIIQGGGFKGLPPEKMKQLSTRIAIGFIGLSFILSVFYTVKAYEVGVVLRFGQYVRTTEPGLRWKLPFGIETVTKVPVEEVSNENFGFRPGIRRDFSGESLMLTGDLNNGVVEWTVHYKIKDAKDYLFNVQNPLESIRDISESAMRQVVGNRSVNEVITTGRQELEHDVLRNIQEILDVYGTGIEIRSVELQDVNPPDAVKASFNEVNQAKQEREKLINQAWEAYNKAVPRAKGEAEKVLREAEGYATRRVNEADGDASRFLATWEEYKKAKDVTKRRLYLETLTKILPKIHSKIIMDEDQKGIVPFLNLSQKGGSQS